MVIDIAVAAFVLIFALLGIAAGFWGQVLRLAALGSLYFIAPPVARAIEGPVANFLGEGATPQTIHGASLIVAAVGLYLIMSFLIWIILRSLRGDREVSGASRFGGFLLGALKGGALAYLILAGLVMVAHSQYYSSALERTDWWVKNASDSKLVGLVSEHNLLEEMGYELPTPEEIQAGLGEHTPEFVNDAAEGTGQDLGTPAATPQTPVVPGQQVPPPTQGLPGTQIPGPQQPAVQQPGTQPLVVPTAPVVPDDK